ncbi:MAG: sensor histidine kinase [Bacteroidetes bacterium]|nr:sensor histidine kinase [Bacteroidota bacterium]
MILNNKIIKIVLFVFLSQVFLANMIHAQMTRAQVDSLKKVLSTSKEDTNRFNLLIKLVDEVGYYDSKEASRYAKEGYALAEKIKYTYGVGLAAYLIGQTDMYSENYSSSDSFLTIAENTKIYSSKKQNAGKIYNERGYLNYMQGNYYAASMLWAKSSEIFEELKDTTSELIAYQNLIGALAFVKNYERAVELGKKVLPLAELRKDTLQIGYTLQGLTTDLLYLNRVDEAGKYIAELMVITETTVDNNLAADSYNTIGMFFDRKKDFEKALSFYLKSLDKATTFGFKFQIASQKKSVGSAYLQLNNLPMAWKYLNEAYQMVQDHRNVMAESNIAIALSDYYEKLGDYKKALLHLRKYVELKDSITGTDIRNHTSYLEAQFESKKKETEIAALQKSQEEKDRAIQKRNLYIAIGIGLLILMGIIFLLLYRNYNNKQKIALQEKALQDEQIKIMEKQQQVLSLQSMINGQETERTRIARDLHDGLGGLFSTVKMHFSTLQHNYPLLKDDPLYHKTFDLVSSASSQLREIAHNMMPEVLMKLGLVEAMKDFCNNINAGKLLNITLQAYGMEKRLNTSTEIMLFRILQELVNNIIKHAYASEAIIQFNRDGNRLNITVEDNGRGFDIKDIEEKRAMGIEAVKSRIVYLNGKIAIDSRENIGTTVMIDLLINEI